MSAEITKGPEPPVPPFSPDDFETSALLCESIGGNRIVWVAVDGDNLTIFDEKKGTQGGSNQVTEIPFEFKDDDWIMNPGRGEISVAPATVAENLCAGQELSTMFETEEAEGVSLTAGDLITGSLVLAASSVAFGAIVRRIWSAHRQNQESKDAWIEEGRRPKGKREYTPTVTNASQPIQTQPLPKITHAMKRREVEENIHYVAAGGSAFDVPFPPGMKLSDRIKKHRELEMGSSTENTIDVKVK